MKTKVSKYKQAKLQFVAWLHDIIGETKLGYGFFIMVGLFLGLSLLATYDFSPAEIPLAINEVSPYDITADRAFIFVDSEATRRKKEEIRAAAPLICDLNLENVTHMYKGVQEFFELLGEAKTPEEIEALRVVTSNRLSEDFPANAFATLTRPEVQRMVTEIMLPWLEARMRQGIISDTRILLSHRNSIIVRNLESGDEDVRSDAYSIIGVKEVEADLNALVRGLDASPQVKKALLTLFDGQILPTLTPNYDATAQRLTQVISEVEPIKRQVRKGEIIVRQGEAVSAAQHLELQALWNRKVVRFQHTRFIGIFTISLLLSSGLFFSPTAKRGSKVTQKDLIFIASTVALFSLMAKGFSLMGQSLAAYDPDFIATSMAFAVPVAGAAGLAALIFSTRRYFSLSMLLSFFATIMVDGGLGMFIFYFLSAMLSTWLVARSQTRQDVMWSIMPLVVGLYAMWAGATFFQGGPHTRYLSEAVAVLAGGTLSMILTFALPPVIELFFRYTTRFLLMELLNLDHPLMRELMLKAPGTYHHSLIVSNMVEAAAKSIGAHGLLCRVGALYHDIGKLEKPNYFIENQYNIENPHDRLTPTLSALILTSHVKRGVELAQQHHLGSDVTGIIQQHHGTGAIRYFYQKALKENPSVKVEDFCYHGPRPQTREAALVMLADAVEASSRTLADPTPSRIKTHVQDIIRNILADGQLEEADLTFRDLNKIAESFHIILAGIFHHRIEYPDRVPQKPKLEGNDAQKAEEHPAAQWLASKAKDQRQVRVNPATAQLSALPAKKDDGTKKDDSAKKDDGAKKDAVPPQNSGATVEQAGKKPEAPAKKEGAK